MAEELALAIASSPEAIAQNKVVSELSREAGRLTQRVSDLSGAQAKLDAANAALQAAIDAGAAVILDIQNGLPPDADGVALAMALAASQDAIASSGAITNLSFAVDAAKANLDLANKAQADLVVAQAKLDEAIAAGAAIILQIQAALSAPRAVPKAVEIEAEPAPEPAPEPVVAEPAAEAVADA